MASLMEELLDVLGKEEKQYQELITLATEKTDAVVQGNIEHLTDVTTSCLLYTSPSPRDRG